MRALNNVFKHTITKTKSSCSEQVIIKGEWFGPAVSWECSFIKDKIESGDSADHFSLEIKGGTVTKGQMEMWGSMERGGLIEMLEVILSELKK